MKEGETIKVNIGDSLIVKEGLLTNDKLKVEKDEHFNCSSEDVTLKCFKDSNFVFLSSENVNAIKDKLHHLLKKDKALMSNVSDFKVVKKIGKGS